MPHATGYRLIALLQIKWMSPLVKYCPQTLIGYSRMNMYTDNSGMNNAHF